MEANYRKLRPLFNMQGQYGVPLYQRGYVWNREDQWAPLWDDIARTAETRMAGEPLAHFLGAVVFMQEQTPAGTIDRRLVIDGQQRMTTVSMIVLATSHVCQLLKAPNAGKVSLFARNSAEAAESPEEVPKVWPTNIDRAASRAVHDATSADDVRAWVKSASGASPQIAKAFLYFHDQLRAWAEQGPETSDVRLAAFERTLWDDLALVVIDLGKEDDPQFIFETLNARGTPLAAADLIKNHLFHKAQLAKLNVEVLYTKYWQRFDPDPSTGFWRTEIAVGRESRARIDVFLRFWLALENRQEITFTEMYAHFKSVMRERTDIVAVCADMARYAGFYERVATPRADREGRFYGRLETLQTTTVYPLILAFLGHSASEVEYAACASYIESFLVRRMVCNLTTKNYNRFFFDVIKHLDTAGYTAANVRDFLASQEVDSNRWPSDAEFTIALCEKPLYRQMSASRLSMVLRAINDHMAGRDDLEYRGKLTIEHLLPQAWRPVAGETTERWAPPLGDAPPDVLAVRRDDQLHRLGNLALLTQPINSEVSNGAWRPKIKTILEVSGLPLNRALADEAEWNEERADRRGEALAKHALAIWPREKG